jgi:hypothetical protein
MLFVAAYRINCQYRSERRVQSVPKSRKFATLWPFLSAPRSIPNLSLMNGAPTNAVARPSQVVARPGFLIGFQTAIVEPSLTEEVRAFLRIFRLATRNRTEFANRSDTPNGPAIRHSARRASVRLICQ